MFKAKKDEQRKTHNHNFDNPDPWLALELDKSTFIESKTKEALMANNRSWSRRAILPILRPICRLLIVLVQIIRIFLPNSFTSPKLMHYFISVGMKYFIRPDANYLIFRHFHMGSQILKFLGDNIENVKIRSHPLKPAKFEDFRDNMFVQHDLNIYNFVIQVNQQLNDNNANIKTLPPEKIDFSAIQDFDQEINKLPNKWHNFLDLQSAIEIYTPVFALLLSDNDFWRASNSLQLDETIAIYAARIFGEPIIVSMVNNRHPMVPISTLEAGFRLMLHGLDAENLYGFVKQMKNKHLAQHQ